ncbi:unnamed protein product, partial [Auanema sp. JU1783]
NYSRPSASKIIGNELKGVVNDTKKFHSPYSFII